MICQGFPRCRVEVWCSQGHRKRLDMRFGQVRRQLGKQLRCYFDVLDERSSFAESEEGFNLWEALGWDNQSLVAAQREGRLPLPLAMPWIASGASRPQSHWAWPWCRGIVDIFG